MISAKVRIYGINPDEDANYLLRMLQMAWELQVEYLAKIPRDDREDGHRKWKVMDKKVKKALMRQEIKRAA